MIVDVVVDVGNSRIKWGRCGTGMVTETISLAPDDPEAWGRQRQLWGKAKPLNWLICGVHPARRAELAAWVRRQGDRVQLLEYARQLPLCVRLEHPDRAGIDRLLDAVAVNARRRAGAPAVVIDAGSAVTVDWIDSEGAFCGGAIFPGLRLMAKALHDYTALLPVVEIPATPPPLPGTTTRTAMEAGIIAAVTGGIRELTHQLATLCPVTPELYLGGGDGPLLERALKSGSDAPFTLWPEMTLEGMRLTAETLA